MCADRYIVDSEAGVLGYCSVVGTSDAIGLCLFIGNQIDIAVKYLRSLHGYELVSIRGISRLITVVGLFNRVIYR